jgi:hypothetical protein
MRSLPTVIVLAAACLFAEPAHAQDEPDKPVFGQVIGQATGRNGYEELVLATDRLLSSRLYRQMRAKLPQVPLEAKRQLLSEKVVADALRLLKQGLAKPVYSPRTDLSFDTLLPEISRFRDLAKLLVAQQYVQLADGRTGEAIDSARMCLVLGHAVQTDTLISGLVGIAITNICINTLGEHLDQLPARDCERLFRICLEALATPDSQSRIYAIEHATIKRVVTDLVNHVKRGDISSVQKTLGADEQQFASISSYIRTLSEADLDRLMLDTHGFVDRYNERLQGELRKQPWERRADQLEIDEPGPAAAFAKFLIPATNLVNDRYVQDHARLRLLAVHCAILRYRWEHDRLPATLEVLNVGDLIVDPFTGQRVEYEVRGSRTYTLSSAGPKVDNNNPRSVNGREPVIIPRTQ